MTVAEDRETLIRRTWEAFLRTQKHGKPIGYDFDKSGPLRLPIRNASVTDAVRDYPVTESLPRVVRVSWERGHYDGKPAARLVGVIENEPGEPVALEGTGA